MTAGAKASVCTAGLLALVALAGCGDDDDAKTDGAKDTGAERPSRGFEQNTGRSKPRLLVMALTFDNGRDCSGYILDPRSTAARCKLGVFKDLDSTPGNPLSPIAGGWGAAAFDRVGDDFKSEYIALRSGDEKAAAYARLTGEGPPLTFAPKRNDNDTNGPPPGGGSGTTTWVVEDGEIPEWGAVNIRTGTDPDQAGVDGGPMKVTVKRLPPTDDAIYYTITLEGYVTYDSGPGKAQN